MTQLVVFSDQCVSFFHRLVSSVHAVMATIVGVCVVSSCRGNVIDDRLDYVIHPATKQWLMHPHTSEVLDLPIQSFKITQLKITGLF